MSATVALIRSTNALENRDEVFESKYEDLLDSIESALVDSDFNKSDARLFFDKMLAVRHLVFLNNSEAFDEELVEDLSSAESELFSDFPPLIASKLRLANSIAMHSIPPIHQKLREVFSAAEEEGMPVEIPTFRAIQNYLFTSYPGAVAEIIIDWMEYSLFFDLGFLATFIANEADGPFRPSTLEHCADFTLAAAKEYTARSILFDLKIPFLHPEGSKHHHDVLKITGRLNDGLGASSNDAQEVTFDRFFKGLQDLVDDGNLDEALDSLFETMDYHLMNSRFEVADMIMEAVATSDLSFDLLLGFLTITNRFKNQLPARANLYDILLEKGSAKYGEVRIKKILRGLAAQ